MIKTIKMFETTDGEKFRLQTDAERHQAIIKEDEEQIYYMFNITVEQQFETIYEIETDKGLEAAKAEVLLAVKNHLGNQVKLVHRDWDGWEPLGNLNVLDIEETD